MRHFTMNGIIDKIRNSHLQISTQVYLIMEVDKSYISNPKEGILHMITMVRNFFQVLHIEIKQIHFRPLIYLEPFSSSPVDLAGGEVRMKSSFYLQRWLHWLSVLSCLLPNYYSIPKKWMESCGNLSVWVLMLYGHFFTWYLLISSSNGQGLYPFKILFSCHF